MAKANPLVSIITINFNSIQFTLELLDSLRHSNYSPIEIIVVDNGSTNNPQNEILSKYPNVIFKRSEQNLGFAGGNNLGISLAAGSYLFFINNDTEVTPNLIEGLVNTLESNPMVGAVSPKIKFFSTNLIQFAGYTNINPLTARNKAIGNKEEDTGLYTGLNETPYTHGAAMMIPKKMIQSVGPMPEDFFLYYEELDWCEQIKRAGFKLMVNLSSVIYHKESMSVGKSSPLKLFYQTRNRILFVRRNMSVVDNIIFHLYFYLIVSPIKLLKMFSKGDWASLKVYWSAIQLAKNYTA